MPSLQRAKEYLAQPIPADALPGLVVITGGTSGIGPAIGTLLARKGCGRIIIVGRNQTAAEGVLSSMREVNEGGQYEFVMGDLM
jgi:NAD(P)-dependent dehydrogenase (short-subunit alcohol dehydrogenase family)